MLAKMGVPSLIPSVLRVLWGMDVQSLANRAHVHRTTISRAQGAEKLQGFLRDAMRVMRAAVDINHSLPDALFWFRNEAIGSF